MIFDLTKYIDAYNDGEDLGNGFEWVDIYGAPPNKRGKHSTLMRNNPEYASAWLGWVLTQVVCEPTDNPILEVAPLREDSINQALMMTNPKDYEIKAEV